MNIIVMYNCELLTFSIKMTNIHIFIYKLSSYAGFIFPSSRHLEYFQTVSNDLFVKKSIASTRIRTHDTVHMLHIYLIYLLFVCELLIHYTMGTARLTQQNLP